MFVRIIAGALALAPLSTAAEAAVSFVNSGTRAVNITGNGPVGQSFTATDAFLTDLAFQFSTINATTTGTLNFSLFAGEALSGTSLASQTTTLTGLRQRALTDFISVFTGRVALVTGQRYTAVFDSSANVMLGFGPNSTSPTTDVYAGGRLFKSDTLDQACLGNQPSQSASPCDANFRLTTAAAVTAVPEPSSWALLLVGFGASGIALRRRSRVSQIA